MNKRSFISEKHQKDFGEPLELKVKNKTGQDHYPTITVEYRTRWGIYELTGNPGENQRTVAERLATQILSKLM